MQLGLILLQSNPDQEQIQKMAVAMMAIMPIVYIVFMAIVILPFWFICKKVGFSPWLSLLNVIPTFGTLILRYLLAFAEWKVTPSVTPQLGYPYPPAPPRA
jgi:hypothetical protein